MIWVAESVGLVIWLFLDVSHTSCHEPIVSRFQLLQACMGAVVVRYTCVKGLDEEP